MAALAAASLQDRGQRADTRPCHYFRAKGKLRVPVLPGSLRRIPAGSASTASFTQAPPELFVGEISKVYPLKRLVLLLGIVGQLVLTRLSIVV